ncbi:hypothetical protein MPH_02254 [Macrophomina phaseolina MS6]|uniref:Uncharacterized protein n=1 Tax=Macrophomina phaseolina (strain MS6) TaxID=1126212 RepID=K2SDH3_MACPH|nr:hypothetical protein MPH_02254 [Macrophomina phaseolina MS6]
MKILKIIVAFTVTLSLAAFIATWVIGKRNEAANAGFTAPATGFGLEKAPLFSHTASDIGFTEDSATREPGVVTVTVVVSPLITTFLTILTNATRLNHTVTSGALANATALPPLRPIEVNASSTVDAKKSNPRRAELTEP